MKRKYYFVSGLPRSGSTLLCNVLAQNPRFHATATSGIMDVMFGVRNSWDGLIEFKASPNEAGKKRVLKGILDSFYDDTDKPVVFDKCRGWLSLIEMAEYILDEKVKILVPVRDIRDAVASMEKIWRANAQGGQVSGEVANYFQFQTTQGRAEFWLRTDQLFGIALNRIQDALNRGYRDRLYFVEFEKLTNNPEQTMKEIYEFLNEPYFKHDFDNVEQVTFEDDVMHGIPNLHKIRQKIEPIKPQWQDILGVFARDYAKFNFWKPESERTK